VSSPAAPAAKAYAETTVPNWAAEMDNAGMITAPSGAMSMKSRTTANCRNASMPTTSF
jgi:hypothetical protein